MLVFISHNRADKIEARLLAQALTQQGVNVWFDEWEIRPGDSIAGGIEQGLSDANVFVLVWSAAAAASSWVGTELRAYLHRRVSDHSLRIIPIWLDDTPAPALVADYNGFPVSRDLSMEEIATEITGNPPDREIARVLQERLLHLTRDAIDTFDPLPYRVCEKCGSGNLRRSMFTDYKRDDEYMEMRCLDCNWAASTEL